MTNQFTTSLDPVRRIDRASRDGGLYAQDKYTYKRITMSGGVRFDIFPTRVGAGSGATVAGWLVDNLEAEMEDLRGRGITFEEYDFPDFKTVNGIAEIEGFRGAWFKDSEGNVLAVAHDSRKH